MVSLLIEKKANIEAEDMVNKAHNEYNQIANRHHSPGDNNAVSMHTSAQRCFLGQRGGRVASH